MKFHTTYFFCLLFSIHLLAQEKTDITFPQTKRFIDKVELFAGPSLSFNHGNKFIENYDGYIIQNRRKVKIGYGVGFGFYHPVNDWLWINLRLSYEEKGTKSQMDLPDLEITSEYTYKYTTISIAPAIFFGGKNKFSLSIGGYYGKILNSKGYVAVLDIQDNVTYSSNFYGRQIRELRADGSTNSITFAPGLQSFNRTDFGIIFSARYLITINSTGKLILQLQDGFGLANINNSEDLNPPEKNHTLSFLIGYILNRKTN